MKGKLEKKQKIITKKSTTKSFKQEKQFITPPSNINNDLNQAEITENIQSKTTPTKNSLKTNEIKEFQIIKKENRQKLAPYQSTNKKEKVSEEPKLSDFVLELFILFIPLIYSLAKYNYKPIKCNRSKLDNRQSIVILSKEQFLLCNKKVDYYLIVAIIIWLIINCLASLFHFLFIKYKKLNTTLIKLIFLFSFIYLYLKIVIIIDSSNIITGITEVASLKGFLIEEEIIVINNTVKINSNCTFNQTVDSIYTYNITEDFPIYV